MSKVLRLYNSYLRCVKEARLGKAELPLIARGENSAHPTYGSFYICGPTVYSESHLGHALTYVRADLFRRFLKSLFNVRLVTVMNITDIDDKILVKSRDEQANSSVKAIDSDPSRHPFNRVSEKYYKSFLDDMNLIRVAPPDLTVKVSKQINLITNYIRKLERQGHAYLAPNGDIYFKVSSLPNYQGRLDARKDNQVQPDASKRDARDFVLWKAAKPNEPIWLYTSDVTGKTVPGRPGWHVQCSAISSAIFGNELDFHFGGMDLIFPHHYNEQACCCAYHNLDTTKSFHVWSRNWLHSGHLVLRDEKMSKSLGNVVEIKSFINETSVNALRLLCIRSHYRANVNLNSELMDDMKSLDHKIGAFTSFLSDELHRVCDAQLEDFWDEDAQTRSMYLEEAVKKVHEDILEGVCDDFDLAKGLNSILDLAKMVYNAGSAPVAPKDLVAIWHLLVDWCSACGLDYGSTSGSYDVGLVQLVKDFRQNVRNQVVEELRRRKKEGAIKSTSNDPFLESLLKDCDNLRSQMDELGLVIRDKKA